MWKTLCIGVRMRIMDPCVSIVKINSRNRPIKSSPQKNTQNAPAERKDPHEPDVRLRGLGALEGAPRHDQPWLCVVDALVD